MLLCWPAVHVPPMQWAGLSCTRARTTARIAKAKMAAEPAEKRQRVPMKLGYWKIRGLAQPIRLLLAYTGTEFEDVLYEQGDAPGYSTEEWTSVKFTLGLDFPNLPYLIDGDLKLTQSLAIFHYIARKHNLCGKTEEEQCAAEMLEHELIDFKGALIRCCYGKEDLSSVRDNVIAAAKAKIKRIADFVGDKTWSTGCELTTADFLLYEAMECYRVFEPTILDDFPNIKAFLARFEALPAIADFMGSDRFIQRPFNNKIAQWT